MDKELIYISNFKEVIPQYLDYKRSLGFSYSYDYAKRFREMDHFFAQYFPNSSISLTKKMVLDFVKKRDNESNSTICTRCCVIRGFAEFLKKLGYKNIYILPNKYIPKKSTDFVPYIFSHEQIKTLFKIIDNYTFGSEYLNNHNIYSALIRLLYGCGLRISEALSLKVNDIDFPNYIIHVLESKNKCSRIVCMSNSLADFLKQYIFDNKLESEQLLFSSPSGEIYSQSAVLRLFKNFFKQANIYTTSGGTPRVHDFRHTFAVHSLQKMINKGMDIYCTLPFLSSFLGHKTISSTEIYVRLVENSFSELRINNSKDIFPEVSNNEE